MNPLAPLHPLGYPAPFWFLELFKVIGFILHTSLMNLWYAGMPLVVILALTRSKQGRFLSKRLARVMPFILALGINFGIIPLLFTQVVNYQFFYAATIMIAWAWFSIIILLNFAYYGIYIQANTKRRPLALWSGAISAVFLVIIGFIFANGFSLMVRPNFWLDIFRHTNVAGAPTGLALNTGDPTLLPRWLMMFGLAITTTAAYIAFDALIFAKDESEEYARWARKFSFGLYTLGLVWFAGFGSWYIFGTLPAGEQQAVLSSAIAKVLFTLTALSPGLTWLLLILLRSRGGRTLAYLAAGAQLVVIALNATSRQWLQNTELRPYADLAAVPARTQWGSLILFVLGLSIAVWLSVWMIGRLRAGTPEEKLESVTPV